MMCNTCKHQLFVIPEKKTKKVTDTANALNWTDFTEILPRTDTFAGSFQQTHQWMIDDMEQLHTIHLKNYL